MWNQCFPKTKFESYNQEFFTIQEEDQYLLRSSMDPENLISRDVVKGTFCILFRNKDGLTDDEIQDIFSKFGKVINLRKTGDDKGFRFIRYKYEDEARRAIEGLKGHPSIIFSVPKERYQANSNSFPNRKDNFSNIAGTNKLGDVWDINNTNEHATNSLRNFFHYPRQSARNDNQVKGDSESVKSDNSWTWNEGKEDNLSEKQNTSFKHAKSNNFSYQNKNRNYQKKNSYQSKNYNQARENSESIKSYNSCEKKIPPKYHNQSFEKLFKAVSISGSCQNESFSTHNSSTNENNVNEEEIPDLVTPTKNAASPKMIVKRAEEVVVGNIHPEVTVSYILHLFDCFEPIGISMINIIPNTNIRYCHVYFKSLEDSVNVEARFDQTDLSGQKLVVLRPCRLFQEAT